MMLIAAFLFSIRKRNPYFHIMKYAFLVFISLTLSISSIAQKAKINWMSWDEAVEANKNEPRLIFVDTYTNWCGWCKRMDQTTFAHPVIVDYMNKHYYSVKLNAEMKDTIDFNGHKFVNMNPTARRGTHSLAASLLDNKMSYPSFVFLNQQFQRLQIVPGYQRAEQFEKFMRYYNEAIPKGQSQEEYLSNFESLIQN